MRLRTALLRLQAARVLRQAETLAREAAAKTAGHLAPMNAA